MGDCSKKDSRNCGVCGMVAYQMERITVEGRTFHPGCFKCHKCEAKLSLSKFSESEKGRFYCKFPSFDGVVAVADDPKPFVVALDVDEVLAQYLKGFVTFHNVKHATNLKVSDFQSYKFWETTGGT